MNNATEACRMYVEKIRDLEARNASMQTVAFQAQEMAKELCARAEAAEAKVEELEALVAAARDLSLSDSDEKWREKYVRLKDAVRAADEKEGG